MSKLTATVTEEDIKLGVPCCAENCPVARAVKRETKHDIVRVSGTAIVLGPLLILSPDSVKEFINNFDYGKPVQPFTFTLENDDGYA